MHCITNAAADSSIAMHWQLSCMKIAVMMTMILVIVQQTSMLEGIETREIVQHFLI